MRLVLSVQGFANRFSRRHCAYASVGLCLVLLSGCLLQDPERLAFATDPHILRGTYQGKIDTRLRATALDLTSDASTLVMGVDDGVVQLWDTRNQTVLQTFGQVGSTWRPVDDVAMTADGALVASSRAGTVTVWDSASATLRWQQPGSTLELDARGTILAVNGGGENATLVRLYEPATGNLLREVMPPGDFLDSLLLSRDGTLMATVSSSNTETTLNSYLRVWQTQTGKVVFSQDSQSNDYTLWPEVAFAANSQLMAYSAQNALHFYDLVTGREQKTLPRPAGFNRLALNPDGTLVAVEVVAEDMAVSTTIVEVASGTTTQHFPDASMGSWSQDGASLLVFRKDGLEAPSLAPGMMDDPYFTPTLLDAESYTEVGRYFNGQLFNVTLEATPSYLDELQYRVSGTLLLDGQTEPLPFEGRVRGNESQRYLSAQARLPTPAEFELTVQGRPWILRGYQDWLQGDGDYEQSLVWRGYLDDTSVPKRDWLSSYLEFEPVTD